MGEVMPSAGNYKWRGLIQDAPTAKLAGGTGDPAGWLDYDSRWMSIEEVPGGKADDGVGQKQSNRYFHAEMRVDEEINTTQRIIVSGRPYEGLTMYVNGVQHTKKKTLLLLVVRKSR